jgi:hypothetical protein
VGLVQSRGSGGLGGSHPLLGHSLL